MFKPLTKPSKKKGAFNDFSSTALIAGIVAIIVGYAGPTAIIFQISGLTDSQITSWLWSYSIGSALVTIYASWTYRQPLIMAWSTPGIAFLVFSMQGVAFSDAIGAFLVSNALIFIIGYMGLLKKVMAFIPISVASALNAGILLPFALKAINGGQSEPEIVIVMVVTFFLVRIYSPRWAVASVVCVGFFACIFLGKADFSGLEFSMAVPVFTAPTFTIDSIINIAIPLTALTVTGQYLPGLAVVKSYGYEPDNDRIVKLCSTMSLLAAPFGCHNINPSSLIASIVAGPEANSDPSRRYWAAIVAGFAYVVFGSLAASFVYLFSSLPKEAIMALAGVSLLGAIAHSMKTAMKQDESDIVTPTVVFIVAISNFELFSIGAPFWAIIIGLILSLPKYVRTEK